MAKSKTIAPTPNNVLGRWIERKMRNGKTKILLCMDKADKAGRVWAWDPTVKRTVEFHWKEITAVGTVAERSVL